MAKELDEGGYYEDDDILEKSEETDSPEVKKSHRFIVITVMTGLILAALVARLSYLLVFSDPDNPGAGWFGDSYHHWQIGYLTEQVGLSHGFLRVWDLKGMDLFWGALHPLLLAFAFKITGNESMALARSITCVAGALSVGLIYLIGRRYWNNTVGIMAALFTALCSVIIFNDATGMVEPLGIPFLLAGIYLWPRYALFAGISFGIALMTRSEYWIYSSGLIFMYTVWDRSAHMDRKVLLWLGFALVLIPYMKYLLDYTANPIYPFYQNFFKNIAGEWQYKKVLEPADLRGQFIFRIILAITALATFITLWRKPKGWQFHLLGLGNWLFLGLTFGVSNYIKSWADYVWVVRFMLYPYTFLGVAIAVFLFYTIRNKFNGALKTTYTIVAACIFLGLTASTHLAWAEINKYYQPTNATWEQVKTLSTKLIAPYKGGKILMIEGNPDITYALVHFHNIQGKDLISQMYDPYFYFAEENKVEEFDPYPHWNEIDPYSKDGLTYRQIVLDFLKENDIKYLITYSSRSRYTKLIELEPQLFEIADANSGGLITYYVHSERI